jgi:HSP20 family protein
MADGPSGKADFFGRLSRELDRRMGSLLRGTFLNWPPQAGWNPPVNLYETADRYLLCVEVAGVDHRQIDVQVTGRVLTIRGCRKDVTPTEPVRVHAMELDHGEFRRDLEFPEPLDAARVQATYKDGLMWIELPKKAEG